MQKHLVFFLLLVCFAQGLFAQGGGFNSSQYANSGRMFDEEEELKYGPANTRFTYEKNFKFNSLIFNNPDTLPYNLHRFSDFERSNYTIQNLGNLGTAQRSMFFQPNEVIGRSSGFESFNAFYTSPDKIRYYDTRSPYTDVYAAFGGGGRAFTKVLFTFNDSIQFNIGFNINSIRADKQLAYLQRGDRHVTGTDWNLFGFLRPIKAPKYLLLWNFTNMTHEVTEQGGILETYTQPAPPFDSLNVYDYVDEDVIFDDATSKEKRGGIHIYQQYDLDSIFQVYHSASYFQQIVRYRDAYSLSTSDSLFYLPTQVDQTSAIIEERTLFSSLTNEIGLKGLTKSFAYTAFYKNRIIQNDNVKIAGTLNDVEHYLGGTLRQQITPKIFWNASGSYLLGGNYLLKGEFSSDFFEASYSRVNRQPSYLQSRFIGQQDNWQNNFNNETSDNIIGRIRVAGSRFQLEPFARFHRISNYLYYGADLRPSQAPSDIVQSTIGTDFNLRLAPKWMMSNTFYYNNVGGGSANLYRMPEFMALTQFAHKNELFDGRMAFQVGVDIHYRSKFTGYGYNPIIQQFHLQDDFENPETIKVDLFLNFKVEHFLFFIKSANAAQDVFNAGYFVTPRYTGPRRTLDVGVRWSFFD